MLPLHFASANLMLTLSLFFSFPTFVLPDSWCNICDRYSNKLSHNICEWSGNGNLQFLPSIHFCWANSLLLIYLIDCFAFYPFTVVAYKGRSCFTSRENSRPLSERMVSHRFSSSRTVRFAAGQQWYWWGEFEMYSIQIYGQLIWTSPISLPIGIHIYKYLILSTPFNQFVKMWFVCSSLPNLDIQSIHVQIFYSFSKSFFVLFNFHWVFLWFN